MSDRLIDAAWEGNLREVRRLIEEEGEAPDGIDWWGQPLEASCARCHLHVVKYLIEKQHSDLSRLSRSAWGYVYSPLHCACGSWTYHYSTHFESSSNSSTTSRSLDVVKYLIETCHCDPTRVDKDGRTPLYYAVTKDKLDVVKYLIETCHCDPTRVDKDGRTPLYYAVTKDKLDVVKYLIETCYCDPMCVDKDGRTPLYYAITKDKLDVVKYLIETCHCDPMCVDKHGQTALYYAITKENIDVHVVKYLNETCQCDPDEYGWTGLYYAVTKGNLNLLKYLIETCHCDPMCVNKYGRTALYYAVTEDKLDMVKYLIETCHCDPMCVDKDGWTPFYYAAIRSKLDVVKYLIETCHFDPMCVDKDGRTPLYYAVAKNKLDVVKYLIETRHCDPMCVDKDGRTPLHWAIKSRSRNIADYLLVNCKCNPNCKDKRGDTPLELDALTHSCTSILLEAGARPTAKPPLPPVKIFIVGNPSVGKSSLTKALQTETSTLGARLSFIIGPQLVRDVEQKTAGIVSCQFTSKSYGEVTFFDFAGQQEYYASHAALLKSSISSSTPLFLIVSDLRDSKEDIKQKLVFWMTFLANQCTSVPTKPHVVIVGSHKDVVKSRGEDPRVKVDFEFDQNVASTFHIYDFIPMDCRQHNSHDIIKLRTSLKNICETIRKELDATRLHYLYVFLLDKFRGVSAVTCEEVQRLASSESLEIPLRQDNPDYLYNSCEELDKAGYIIFIKHHNITKSWIVLDQDALMSEVNAVLFAPEGFKEHCDLANATGVASVCRLAEEFPQHDQEMLVLFLSHFEFCQEIHDNNVLQLINQDHCESTDERYLFFPGLVSLKVPSQVWEPDPHFPHYCGWMLQCCDPGQYLTSQFLQVLLLRIAFSCALALDKDDYGSDILQRKCKFWRNGIYWSNPDGVKALVEISDPPQMREVVVMLCCLEGKEMDCAHLRSTIIQLALKAKEQFCSSVQTKQFFIRPSLLKKYPFKCDCAEQNLVSVTEVKKAIDDDESCAINKTGQPFELNELLVFKGSCECEKLFKFLKAASPSWRKIASELDFKFHEQNNITYTRGLHDIEGYFQEMLCRWLKREPKHTTVGVLCKALRSAGEERLAYELEHDPGFMSPDSSL